MNNAQHRYQGALPSHGRFAYRPITRRPHYQWPGGARLAVYLGFNVEHFAFGEGLGAGIGPSIATTRRAELQLARIRKPSGRMALPGALRTAWHALRRIDQYRALRPLSGAGGGHGGARR